MTRSMTTTSRSEEMKRRTSRAPLEETSGPTKDEQRQKLARDMEAFMEAGGCVERVPSGVSGAEGTLTERHRQKSAKGGQIGGRRERRRRQEDEPWRA